MWALLGIVLVGEATHLTMGGHLDSGAGPAAITAPVQVAVPVVPEPEPEPEPEALPEAEPAAPAEPVAELAADPDPEPAAPAEPVAELAADPDPEPAAPAEAAAELAADPRPEPAADPQPEPAPAPKSAAPPQQGDASFTLIGVDGYLQGASRKVFPGAVPAGSYTLMVRFGEGEFRESKQVEVSPGAQITIRCGFGMCQVEG